MPDNKEYMFGPADIIIGEGEDQVAFDGSDYLQAEGGTLTITPNYTPITVIDFGETPIDQRLTGWDVQISVTAAQEDAKILDVALASTTPITNTDGGEDGAMDAPIGSSPKGRRVRIHPRNLPDSIKERDWVIYKAASTEGFERNYDAAQGSITINLTAMPRDGFDASKPGNFFYRGAVDPNAEDTDSGNGDGEDPNQ